MNKNGFLSFVMKKNEKNALSSTTCVCVHMLEVCAHMLQVPESFDTPPILIATTPDLPPGTPAFLAVCVHVCECVWGEREREREGEREGEGEKDLSVEPRQSETRQDPPHPGPRFLPLCVDIRKKNKKINNIHCTLVLVSFRCVCVCVCVCV